MLTRYILIIAALFLSSHTLAQWQLVNDQSTLNYVSIKKSKVAEVNNFKQLEGTIAQDGKVLFEIDLASVETNIPIRNERVKSMLFKVDTFAKATIGTTVETAMIDNLTIGDIEESSLNFTLSLHGVSKNMSAVVQVVKLAEDKILVSSITPIIVNADQHNLSEGIEKLREAAGLPSISMAVPVTFNLIFTQQSN